MKILSLSALWLVLLLAQCDFSPDFPTKPQIKFESYQKLGQDSAVRLTISYLDGDGDLGLKDAQTAPPFDTGSRYYYNMFIQYYEFIDGQFQQVTRNIFSEDTIRYQYRFPYITPKRQNKAIKGEIQVELNVTPTAAFNRNINYGGLIRFKLYIVDRALHKSNTVTSPAIPFKAR